MLTQELYEDEQLCSMMAPIKMYEIYRAFFSQNRQSRLYLHAWLYQFSSKSKPLFSGICIPPSSIFSALIIYLYDDATPAAPPCKS